MLISLILVFSLLFCGCDNSKETTAETTVNNKSNYVYVYYPEGNNIVLSQDGYQLKQPDSITHSVEEVMSVCLEVYAGKMESYSYMVDDDNNVSLEITMADECSREYGLLTMASVSDTLFQLDKMGNVKITLFDMEGEMLDSKLILRNTIYYYASDRAGVSKRVTFYKADSDGNKLEALSGSIVLDDNISMVENMVLKLAEIEAIPVGTKVNSANIISGICYIDLSKEFEENVLDTKSDLVVYSVVNSITNINGIDKIMITVEGQVLDNYRGSIDLSEPLSFNKEILK